MKPASFEYHDPSSVDEAASLLSEYDDATLMAGNQSLSLAMSTRRVSPDHLVDLNDVEQLDYVDEDDDVEIGAMTRHRTIAESSLLQQRLPMLSESAAEIGGPAVRNRGTLGGNVAEADPVGNYPVVLTALDATLTLRSADGRRELPVRDFFVGPGETELRDDELVERIVVSTAELPRDRSGMAFHALKPTPLTGPKLSAAGAVRVDDPTATSPMIEEARLALGNAADVPLRVETAEEVVRDEPLSEDVLEEAAAAALDAAEPVNEPPGDADYRQAQVGVYTRRALQTAYERPIDG